MKIKRIEYLNKARNECFLTLTNNETEIVCFSDMEEHFLGEEIGIDTPLQLLSVRNILIPDSFQEEIEKFGDHSYKIIGHLINKEEGLVISKSFFFHIDPHIIPGDFKASDAIYFEAERIDLF
jgi:hypothetical protein